MGLFLILPAIVSCKGESAAPDKDPPPLVREGMSAAKLRETIGRPDSVVISGTVYDVELGQKRVVSRWYYPKRTVLLIDDTVKVGRE